MDAVHLVKTHALFKARLHNMRYPRSGHKSGDFAIAIFDVYKVVEGAIPDECLLNDKFSLFKYQVACCGRMPKLDNISDYMVSGTLVIDKEWGPQYEVEYVRLDYDLSNERDQRKFFSFFMTERQVDLLFQDGNNPIEWLENKNIGALTKIKGIGPATAVRMCGRYEDSKDKGRAYVILKDYDLTKNAIDRLVKHYGSADVAVEKIEENPYILIKEVRGYGWKKADAIAMKQGFTRDCKERVTAYTQYFLEDQADSNGNSWIKVEDLLGTVADECSPVSKENLMAWVREMMIDPKDFEEYCRKVADKENVDPIKKLPLLYYDPEERRVGLLAIRFMEKEIARHLKRLSESHKKLSYKMSEIEKVIKKIEEEQGWEYTEEQKNAIFTILDNNVVVLTGSAGTGKTSVLAPVTRIFQELDLDVEQCALSGRASSKMEEVTKVTGKTIHRLLCWNPEADSFVYHEGYPLHADVVILDETSMVGGDLFLSLISAMKRGSRLIMVGDTQQLEAIGYANILKDCIMSGYVPAVMLSKIHRQAARSGIITQSIRVSNGESIVGQDFIGEEVRGELKDFKLVASYDSPLVHHNIIQEFKKLYYDRKIPIEQIQVIVPMRTRGEISCRVLNERIQAIVNPKTNISDIYLEYNDNGMKYKVCYKVNDRIIVTQNNYHAVGTDGAVKAIFNGNVGYIKEINNDLMIINLTEQGDIILDRADWYNIQLAYCITCHKKQGDQIPYAIIGFDTSCYALYSKELLYTAITRASKYCVLVTQPKALNAAVKISRVKLKQTWLKGDLFNLYLDKQEKENKKIAPKKLKKGI